MQTYSSPKSGFSFIIEWVGTIIPTGPVSKEQYSVGGRRGSYMTTVWLNIGGNV